MKALGRRDTPLGARVAGPVPEAVAAYDWDTDRVRTLLREVSAAMGHEPELQPGFLRRSALTRV